MSDRAILSAQIRFALEQLSQRNAQHEFEHLCRYLALQRICANVLPATGPVQAGGDQGRDFETFRSYLATNGLRDSSFIGLISEGMIAFACTLNKEYRTKIRSDVVTIVSSGSRVEAIHYFSVSDVPVAHRHELQAWAREQHQVELEIYDGAALSEMLASYDVFWIAERYLLLPSNLAPAPPTEEDWYTNLLYKWQHASQSARFFADFVEIRAGARHALGEMRVSPEGWKHGYEKSELPFWITQLETIAAKAPLQHLQRKADYEVLVLRLRGLGSWQGHEQRVRDYFVFIPQLKDAVDFADAVTMLSYAVSARRGGWCDLNGVELEAWRTQLREHLDKRCEEMKLAGDRPNGRAHLLETRGHLELCPPAAGDEWSEIEGAIEKALKFWGQMIDVVEEAPLYPIEQFCSRLTAFTNFLAPFEEFQTLCDRADAVQEKRAGTSKIAEQRLERAMKMRKMGRLSDAMRQLHRVRADWYNSETLPKCLMVMLWLGQAYEAQGLCFAARFYALAAAHAALHANSDEAKQVIPKALLLVADTDYAQGAYHCALEATEIAHLLYAEFAHPTEKEERDSQSDINRNLFYLSQMRLVTERLHPELLPWLESEVHRIGTPLDLADVVDIVVETARRSWPESSKNELRAKIEEQTVAPPWSDAGPQRFVHWKAHGISWTAQWDNNYEINLAVEEFLATLQLCLSDLAERDLCLLRSSLNLTFELHDDASDGSFGYNAHFLPSNMGRFCCVGLPRKSEPTGDPDIPTQIRIFGVVLYLLQEVSLLPYNKLLEEVENSFRQGLSGKLLAGSTYREAYQSFFDRDGWNRGSRGQHPALDWPIKDNFGNGMEELIPWVEALLPKQNEQTRSKAIKERYENTLKIIPNTIDYLCHQPSFRQTVATLRTRGWKDWHLLLAVFSVTASYRLAEAQCEIETLTRSALHPSQINEIAQRLQKEPESVDMPVPPATEFSEERLQEALRISMLSTVRVVGLEINQTTPDFGGIEDFLAHRYAYWKDDVPHSDPFVW